MSMYVNWDRQAELCGSIGKLLAATGQVKNIPPNLEMKHAQVHARATVMMGMLDEMAAKALPQMQNVEAMAIELLEEINNQ